MGAAILFTVLRSYDSLRLPLSRRNFTTEIYDVVAKICLIKRFTTSPSVLRPNLSCDRSYDR
jgi:hypothetical protein